MRIKEILNHIYLSDSLEWVHNIYSSIVSFIYNIKRLIEYAPLVWNHRNWEHAYIFKFQKKLYEDLYRGCYVDGHHIPCKKTPRRLKTIINLLDRLSEDSYNHMHQDYLTKRFGEDNMYFKQIEGTESRPGGPYSRMCSTREDRLSAKDKVIYHKVLCDLFKLEETQRKADLRLLGEYIAKYGSQFWD